MEIVGAKNRDVFGNTGKRSGPGRLEQFQTGWQSPDWRKFGPPTAPMTLLSRKIDKIGPVGPLISWILGEIWPPGWHLCSCGRASRRHLIDQNLRVCGFPGRDFPNARGVESIQAAIKATSECGR
jgi:hypothetical protein